MTRVRQFGDKRATQGREKALTAAQAANVVAMGGSAIDGAFEAEVTVRRVRFASESSGWAVLDAAEGDGRPLVLVGTLSHLEEGERVNVVGEWVNDSRFGAQVKVSDARPLPPSDPDALVVYLRRVKHVGAKRAQALVERYGAAGVFDAIDRDPNSAFGVVGLSSSRAREAAESWAELRVLRRLYLLLAPHGLGYLVGRISEEYGSRAAQMLTENPFALTSLFGVSFLTADRIARSVGDEAAQDERPRAAVVHVLAEAERGGSTCLPTEAVVRAARELLTGLGHGAEDGAESASELPLQAMLDDGALVLAGGFLYRAATAELEAELAQRVRERLEEASDAPAKLREPDGRALEAAGAGELTEEQLAGVRSAFTERLSLITGGPGTGKTSTIRTIVAAAAAMGARVMLLAPTGRAATRMSEASGARATTVHSALGWVPGEGPLHDEDDPVRCDLLILDESSMANLELMVALMRAVAVETHVVLVGDADQLAPVGAGKPFAELVEAGGLPIARLTHIFRQAAGSMIVQGAHAVRLGRVPDFRAAEHMRRDLFLIERSDPLAARAEIVELVAERLPAHYELDPVSDIQVFAPVYRGELGIDALNRALRDALNPDGRPLGGGRLRIGDKLMMTGRNLHELGLMNGTVVRLVDEVERGEDDAALLLSGDDGVFRLPLEEAERLRLAYACSVHRGQGIELPVAIIVAHPAAGAFFLRREMLYTAITRAKLATVIVGNRETLARAVKMTDTRRRHGRLAERLAETRAAVG